MQIEIQAGAKVDVVSPEEMEAAFAGLRNYMEEIRRGVRFKRASMVGTVDGSGNIQIGSMFGPRMDFGPDGSFLWAVTRISVHGLRTNNTVGIFVNGFSPAHFVGNATAAAPTLVLGQTGCILQQGDQLAVVGDTLTASDVFTVAAQVAELPIQLAWQLLG